MKGRHEPLSSIALHSYLLFILRKSSHASERHHGHKTGSTAHCGNCGPTHPLDFIQDVSDFLRKGLISYADDICETNSVNFNAVDQAVSADRLNSLDTAQDGATVVQTL
jgi:hypothetical protein